MGNSLATAKPTKYLVKKMAIIKNRGTQLPGIVNLLLCSEKLTNLGLANFKPISNVVTPPIIHRLIVKMESPKTDETPKKEKIIIAIGKMKTVLTLTIRSLL